MTYTLDDFPLKLYAPRPALGQGIVLRANALIEPSPVPAINFAVVLLACELWERAEADARSASARLAHLLPPPPPTPPAESRKDVLQWITHSSPAAES